MKAVFLFGAGASAYSAENQELPPIGPKLFNSLKEANLVPGNIPRGIQEVFEKNFEEGIRE